MSDHVVAKAARRRVLAAIANLEDAVAGVPPEDWDDDFAQLLDAQLAIIGVHTELRQTADALWARRLHHCTDTPALWGRRLAIAIASAETGK
jgi:hypothetical protein